jgi:hypothetical protein
MFNSQRPRLEDLPTNRQLIKATLIAAVAAGVLLVTVILPAEYAIDPTGIGRVLGLTEMGEVKAQLAEEAERDAATDAASAKAAPSFDPAATNASAPAAASTKGNVATREDITTVTLAPGEGAEVKVTADKDVRIAYSWTVEGGVVNYDAHADAPGIAYHGYGKGKQSAGERGSLVAAFDGKHGWFWRNRGDKPVTVTLRTQGAYTEIKRLV